MLVRGWRARFDPYQRSGQRQLLSGSLLTVIKTGRGDLAQNDDSEIKRTAGMPYYKNEDLPLPAREHLLEYAQQVHLRDPASMKSFTLPRGEIRRFTLFLVVGVLAASTALLLRALLNRFVLFELAVAMAQFAGLMVAFALDRIIIFTKFSGSLAGAFSRFFVVNLFSLTILTVVSAVFYRSVLPLIGWSLYPDYTAHFIGMGATALPSYFGHRFYSFRA
jgi:putative flippase GtrA